MKNINPTQTAAWKALQQHFEQMKSVEIADLFAQDADRFAKFSATFDDQMLVDFSKNRITQETLDKLQALAKETDLSGAIKSMFSGRRLTAPKIVRCCTSRCVTGVTHRFWWMAKM